MADNCPPLELTAQFRAPHECVPLDVHRVANFLQRQDLSLDVNIAPRQFAGGLANMNYLIYVNDEPVVLRRPPEGPLPPGAHDMAREYHILSRLWRALPLAPRALALCEDRDVIGVPFQILEFRDGLVISGDDTRHIDGNAERAAALAETLLNTLVSIHQVDTHHIGLDDLGRPQGFVTRGIAGWRKRAARLELEPASERLSQEIGHWLAAQQLITRPAVLLHCDFKLDNLILAPETLAPRGVVDWDMGTRGDPLFDLATLLSYWTQPEDPPCMHQLAQMPTVAPGFPTRQSMVAAYAAATGYPVDDYQVLRVLGMFKLSIIFLQLHALYLSGRRSDPRYGRFGSLGNALLHYTMEIANGNAP